MVGLKGPGASALCQTETVEVSEQGVCVLSMYAAKKWAISELLLVSSSKLVLALNFSDEKEFDSHEMKHEDVPLTTPAYSYKQ